MFAYFQILVKLYNFVCYIIFSFFFLFVIVSISAHIKKQFNSRHFKALIFFVYRIYLFIYLFYDDTIDARSNACFEPIIDCKFGCTPNVSSYKSIGGSIFFVSPDKQRLRVSNDNG